MKHIRKNLELVVFIEIFLIGFLLGFGNFPPFVFWIAYGLWIALIFVIIILQYKLSKQIKEMEEEK